MEDKVKELVREILLHIVTAKGLNGGIKLGPNIQKRKYEKLRIVLNKIASKTPKLYGYNHPQKLQINDDLTYYES